MQPGTVDPTLYLCTKYPFCLVAQCLPDTSTRLVLGIEPQAL